MNHKNLHFTETPDKTNNVKTLKKTLFKSTLLLLLLLLKENDNEVQFLKPCHSFFLLFLNKLHEVITKKKLQHSVGKSKFIPPGPLYIFI